MRVGIIGDTSRHLNGKTLAGVIFANSPLFRYSYTYSEQEYDETFILSAKYGLIEPRAIIQSYDLSLSKMTKIERVEWYEKVAEEMHLRLMSGADIYFHVGKLYREVIPFLGSTFSYHCPMAGKNIGQQLQFYKHAINNGLETC